MSDIDNDQDVIDSRDVIARLDELEAERAELADIADPEVLNPDALAAAQEAVEAWDADNGEELRVLRDLNEEGEAYAADWRDGATLVRDTYFEDYARQLAEELDLVKDDAQWPMMHIDWEAAAEALKIDYTSIDYDGEEYWVRS